MSPPEVVFADCVIPISSHVRSLGVIIDSALTFSDHVTRLISTCFYQLRQIRFIRRSLTIDSTHAIVRALILSRLDYCNGLLSGLPNTLLCRLDGVMRAAARLIFQLQYRDHVSHQMRDQLHWLNAASRIRFKLCVLAFQCRNDVTPSYLARCCVPVASVIGRSCLRSAASGDFFVPACSTQTLGPRAFAASCPASWNSLPPDIRASGISLATFKKKLKTFLFSHMH